MEPALTAEGWKKLQTINPDGGTSEGEVHIYALEQWKAPDKIVIGVEYDSGACNQVITDPHGAAALCLHEQEFGFTRADVDEEREVAKMLTAYVQQTGREGSLDHPIKDGFATIEQYILALAWLCEKRADRIEALLPPEKKS